MNCTKLRIFRILQRTVVTSTKRRTLTQETNIPLHIFGVNATLSGVAEADEESPGGFIADKSTHTNAPRTALTLTACGPAGAAGTGALTWDNSKINVYASPTGGVALAVYTNSYASFSTATLYIEGIAPCETTLTWAYSGQPDCVDEIKVTVVRVEILDASFNPVSELKIAKWTKIRLKWPNFG